MFTFLCVHLLPYVFINPLTCSSLVLFVYLCPYMYISISNLTCPSQPLCIFFLSYMSTTYLSIYIPLHVHFIPYMSTSPLRRPSFPYMSTSTLTCPSQPLSVHIYPFVSYHLPYLSSSYVCISALICPLTCPSPRLCVHLNPYLFISTLMCLSDLWCYLSITRLICQYMALSVYLCPYKSISVLPYKSISTHTCPSVV